MSPSVSATGVCVPRVSLNRPPPLQETLQEQQVGLAQAPIKLLLLPWVLVRVRFCAALEEWGLCSLVLWGPCSQGPLSSQPDALGAPGAGPPGWGA